MYNIISSGRFRFNLFAVVVHVLVTILVAFVINRTLSVAKSQGRYVYGYLRDNT